MHRLGSKNPLIANTKWPNSLLSAVLVKNSISIILVSKTDVICKGNIFILQTIGLSPVRRICYAVACITRLLASISGRAQHASQRLIRETTSGSKTTSDKRQAIDDPL